MIPGYSTKCDVRLLENDGENYPSATSLAALFGHELYTYFQKGDPVINNEPLT